MFLLIYHGICCSHNLKQLDNRYKLVITKGSGIERHPSKAKMLLL